MSHELDLAITLPGQPFILAAPAVTIIAILAIIAIRKTRRKKAIMATWAAASNELGLQFDISGTGLGPLAQGRVNNHVASIKRAHNGPKKRVVTQYSVKFEAPEAPKFNLVKRIDASTRVIDTGNPKFDAFVAIQTDQLELLGRYLTGPRRSAILRLLIHFPSAQITNSEAHLLSAGIEHDHDQLVDSICHLVAAAETFDRPTRSVDAAITVIAQQDTGDITAAPAAVAVDPATADAIEVSNSTEYEVNNESDLLTKFRLDEVTVLDDLFNSDLDGAATTARFQQIYQGHKVNWTGEVLRVGAIERGMQRVAVFVGSADGENPESGRVVALTTMKPEPVVVEGDIVGFSGSLVNLDVTQRLFHVV
jgi:hypothetical protein